MNEQQETPDNNLSEGLVTVAEASGFLSLGRSKLYDLMDAGQLPYVKLGRARRIPRRALYQLIKDNLMETCA